MISVPLAPFRVFALLVPSCTLTLICDDVCPLLSVIVTTSPTDRPCGATVLIVTVVPDSLAPGAASVTVPPPEVCSPEMGLVYWNDREVGTALTVKVPL
jgi:hypothetical protein